jgi:two-component system NtrC family response regulator
LAEYRETTERRYFNELMTQTGGDIRQASAVSGLSRSRLYDLLKKYDLARSGS